MVRKPSLAVPAAALCLAFAMADARALALFSADASFTVRVPGAVVNTFGFARIGPTYEIDAKADGNASAGAVQGSDVVSALPPAQQPAGGSLPGGGAFPDPSSTGVGVTVSGLSILGQAAPNGSADAFSAATLRFNLGNLTGSGAPTPPAQVIVVPVSGSYTYSEAAAAGGCTECKEHADASFRFIARHGKTILLDVFEPVVADFTDPTVPFNFLLNLPANSVSPLTFEMIIAGNAGATALIKNPEPGSLAALGAGLAALGLGRWIGGRRRTASET